MALGFVNEHMDGADTRRGATGLVEEIHAEIDGGRAHFLHGGAEHQGLSCFHRQEKVCLHMAQGRGMRGRGEPSVPTERAAADEFFHRAVREGDGARVKNNARRVGVLETNRYREIDGKHVD